MVLGFRVWGLGLRDLNWSFQAGVGRRDCWLLQHVTFPGLASLLCGPVRYERHPRTEIPCTYT